MTPSPCTTCTDTVTACPCPAHLTWWADSNPEPEPERECLTCVDIEVMALSGECVEQIAARLGMAVGSVETHVRRHGGPRLRRTA